MNLRYSSTTTLESMGKPKVIFRKIVEVKLGSRRQKRVNHSQLLEQRKCEIPGKLFYISLVPEITLERSSPSSQGIVESLFPCFKTRMHNISMEGRKESSWGLAEGIFLVVNTIISRQ